MELVKINGINLECFTELGVRIISTNFVKIQTIVNRFVEESFTIKEEFNFIAFTKVPIEEPTRVPIKVLMEVIIQAYK